MDWYLGIIMTRVGAVGKKITRSMSNKSPYTIYMQVPPHQGGKEGENRGSWQDWNNMGCQICWAYLYSASYCFLMIGRLWVGKKQSWRKRRWHVSTQEMKPTANLCLTRSCLVITVCMLESLRLVCAYVMCMGLVLGLPLLLRNLD